MQRLFLFALPFVFGRLLLAQGVPTVTLTGQVVDDETGVTLPGAHVFIASSMTGTITDDDGRYTLSAIPVGAMRLYVSMLGYEPEAKNILLRTAAVRTFDFRLKPTVIEVGEIIVEAKRDKKWKKRLEKFTRLFVGETAFAEETRITNPEVLDFTESRGLFRAVASEPLIIENNALGYRVQYFLKDFEAELTRTRYDGEPLFEAMVPGSDQESGRWKEQRREAFIGSFRHFMLALLAAKTKEQGFVTYGRTEMAAPAGFGGGNQPGMSGTRFPLDPNTLLRPGEVESEKFLDFEGFVEIVFTGEIEDEAYIAWQDRPGYKKPGFQTSWIRLEKGPTVVDYKGDVLDPYGVTFYGYLAFERVADEVPREYRPVR